MIFGRKTQEQWRTVRWFAWRPVQLDDGRWAWLRWVTRNGLNRGCLNEFTRIDQAEWDRTHDEYGEAFIPNRPAPDPAEAAK